MLIWADTGDDDAAPEGTATPTHNEVPSVWVPLPGGGGFSAPVPIDTRIADALEALHASVTWDSRKLSWTVYYLNADGYPVYDYGASGEARRDVLVRWLLQEDK